MVYQTNPRAIRFACSAARILESLLLGLPLKEALEKAVESAMSSSNSLSMDDTDVGDACLFALLEAKMKDLPEVMQTLVEEEEEKGGRSARYPAAFIVPMFLFYKAIADGEITKDAYVKAVRANILAGGDTCCRAVLLGAILGAASGSVPQSFVDKLSSETMAKVEEAIAGIIESVN